MTMTMRFGAPAWHARAARFGAVAAAAAVPALALAPLTVARPMRIALYALCALAACLCAAAALWTETLEVDPRARTYRYVRGFGRRARVQAGSLDDVRRVELSVRPRLDFVGQPDARCAVRLRTASATMHALRGQPEDLALAVAARLSEELARPLQTVPYRQGPRTRAAVTRYLAIGAVWACLLAVVAVMLWPTLRHPRSLAAAWSGPPPDPNALQARRLESTGDELYFRGYFRDAEGALRRSLALDPRNANAWNTLAYALADQARLPEALNAAEQAHKVDPLSGNILDTVGEMHERRGELGQAVSWYEAALERLAPFDATETHAKLGRTLLALNRRGEAIPHLEQATRFERSQWSRLALRLLREAGAGPANHVTAPPHGRAHP